LDIPATVSELARGVEVKKLGAIETRIDYGSVGFGGACPPEGHGMHRYQFTVWALPTEKLNLAADVSPAVVGFTLNSLALEKATLTATYTR
ncbi:YbhB/YbcL family Raf kinase inhibitor-like protein, partial [Vibrio anguillarum]|nr:YbhB/YbcL family Raf kinase inhibitor-like protein [Vibrio anguillarum]